MMQNCPTCKNSLPIQHGLSGPPVCASCGATISISQLATMDAPRTIEDPGVTKPMGGGRAEPSGASADPTAVIDAGGPPIDRTVSAPPYAQTPAADSPGTARKPARPRQFGNYELIEEVARGGMGVVYKARQRGLNRIVALKMILGGTLASEVQVQRFRTEAQAAANLHHPHIVAIHDVGVHDELHYFSMDFVEGSSLTACVQSAAVEPSRAATYVQKIAEAIHYAHTQGILHRDLKPSNILLDAGDQPRITDFGLAKRIEDQSGLTASGAVLGTPSYMPPEQAAGRHQQVGPASDIYSIGAILYELITGRPPFRAESSLATLRRVLDSEPVRPSLINPSVDRDLETICLKCLQKEPSRRYATGQALADDVGRYLRGEPILARSVGSAERLARWCRRNPGIATLAALVFLLFATVTAGSVAGYWRIRKEQRATQAERERAERNSILARGAVHDMLTRVADELLPDLPQNAQTEKTRLELLQGALSYYRRFLDDNADDPAMQGEIAATLRRAGELYRLLGDDQNAEQSLHRANTIFQDLVGKFPGDPKHTYGLAATHDALGELYRAANQTELAESSYRRAIELFERLVAEQRSDEPYQTALAMSRNNLGILLMNIDRPIDAEQQFDAAIALLAPWLEQPPVAASLRQALARLHINRGTLLRSNRRLEEAEDAFKNGLELMSQLVEAFPSRAEYQKELAACYNNMGNLLLNDPSRREQAAANYRKARDLLAKLAEVSPSVPAYRRELANCCNNLATALRLMDGLHDSAGRRSARQTWQQGLDIAQTLLTERPDIADYHWLFGAIAGNLGGLALDEDELEAARRFLKLAVDHQSKALDSNPSNPTYRAFLRSDCSRLARLLIREGDHSGAVAHARRIPKLFPDAWQEYQRAARLIAQCVPLAAKDESAAEDARQRVAESYAAEAAQLVQQAAQLGFQDWQDLKTNPIYDALRDRPDFQNTIADLEAKAWVPVR